MARNYVVLDTEGVDTVRRRNSDGVHPETSLFYDFGFIIVDGNTGAILKRYSFINSDVFFNQELMNSAYYAEKLPQYYASLGVKWQIADTYTIWKTFTDECKFYKVKNIWAFNTRYDMNITNNTIKQMSNGFRRFFAPYGTKWRDIWDVAGSTICNTRKYVNWCMRNEYMSEKGNPSTSAETIFRYLTQDKDFVEAHTALEDCLIENCILATAKSRKKKCRHSMGQGWRDAANLAKKMRKEAE